jgi:ribosomal protein S27E
MAQTERDPRVPRAIEGSVFMHGPLKCMDCEAILRRAVFAHRHLPLKCIECGKRALQPFVGPLPGGLPFGERPAPPDDLPGDI